MQTYYYARAALWDTAIKFSLQSRAMTSPDHLVENVQTGNPNINLANPSQPKLQTKGYAVVREEGVNKISKSCQPLSGKTG